MKLPAAVAKNLVVQELENETLIYNLTTHQAFMLNETSSIIFNACGSEQTFADLKTKYKYTDELIYLALDELERENLIVDYKGGYFGDVSRREAIKRVGLGTMIALPVIAGLVAPRAVNAVSSPPPSDCVQTDDVCIADNFTQSNCCNQNERCGGFGVAPRCNPCFIEGDRYDRTFTEAPTQDLCEDFCNRPEAVRRRNICCDRTSPTSEVSSTGTCICLC